MRPGSTLEGHQGAVYCASFDPSGNYLLTGGHDKKINLFSVRGGTFVTHFEGHAWEVFDLAVSPSGQTFVSGGGDRALFLWDVASRRIIRKFSGMTAAIRTVAYGGPGGVLIWAASEDRMVRAWDGRQASRAPVIVLDHAKDTVMSVAVSKDEPLLLTGSIDGCVRLYDIRRGILQTDQIHHPVTSVQLTANNQAYICAALDSILRLMDVESGTLLNSYEGHINCTYRSRISLFANDALVVAGSEDGTLFIWGFLHADVKDKIQAHRQCITSVVSDRNESLLATTSLDGTARLWLKPQ